MRVLNFISKAVFLILRPAVLFFRWIEMPNRHKNARRSVSGSLLPVTEPPKNPNENKFSALAKVDAKEDDDYVKDFTSGDEEGSTAPRPGPDTSSRPSSKTAAAGQNPKKGRGIAKNGEENSSASTDRSADVRRTDVGIKQRTRAELAKENQALRSELLEMTGKESEQRQVANSHQLKIEALHVQLQQEKNVTRQYVIQVGQLEDQLRKGHESLQKDVERLKGQVFDGEESIRQKNERIDKLRVEREQLDDAILNMEEKLASNERVINHWSEQIQTMGRQWDTERRELKQRKAELKEALRQKDEVLSLYEKQSSTINSQWEEQERELVELRQRSALLGRLQQEMLSRVDQHEPTFDKNIQDAFIKVNSKMTALVRRGRGGLTLFRLAESTLPFTAWSKSAVRRSWYNPQAREIADLTDSALRLLLRLVVWNFIGQQLLDRARPFAIFGSPVAKRLQEAYEEMFPDYSR
jgi:hypothetical protein